MSTEYIEKLLRENDLFARLFYEFFEIYSNTYGFENAFDRLVDLGVTDEEFEIMGFDREDVARARERN
jgi:hypothetical protein